MSGHTLPTVADKEAMQRIANRAYTDREEGKRLDSLLRDRIGGVLDPIWPSLAQEIAQDIHDLDTILTNHGFEQGSRDPRWAEVQVHPEFQRLLTTALAEWNKADSTTKRIRHKAAAAVEAMIPHIFQMAIDTNNGDTGRTKAMEILAKMAGVANEPQAAQGPAGGGFTLKINLSSGRRMNVINQQGETVGSEPSGQTIEVEVQPLQAPAFLLSEPTPVEE